MVAKDIFLPLMLIVLFFGHQESVLANEIDSLRKAGFDSRYADKNKSIHLQQQALSIALKNGPAEEAVVSYYRLAVTYAALDDLNLQTAYSDSAYYAGLKQKTPKAIAYGNLARGGLYFSLDQKQDAIPYLYKAYTIFDREKNYSALVSVTAILSAIFSEANPERARKMASSAVQYATLTGKKEEMIYARIAYGYVAYMMRIDDVPAGNIIRDGIIYYRETIKQLEPDTSVIVDKKIIIPPYICIAILYSHTGIKQHNDSTFFYAMKAKNLTEQYHRTELLGNVLGIIGEYYITAQKYDEAKALFEKGIGYMKQNDADNNKVIAALYRSLGKMAIEKNDFRKYYEYDTSFEHYDQLRHKDAVAKGLEMAHNRYESARKATIISALERESKIQARNKGLLIIISILLGSGLILVYALYYFRNKYNIQRQARLEEHNKMAVLELQLQKKETVGAINQKLLLERKFLQSQMNPHFAYNVMGSLQYYLLKNDTESALFYMDIYAVLMRRILMNLRRDWIPVRDEIEMLESYIQLQMLRLNNSFSYVIDIDEEATSAIQIPPMLIQPFVENAIEHGLKYLDENIPGRLIINVRRSDDRSQLIWSVEDNGVGITIAKEKNKGLGAVHESLATKITAERIEQISDAENRGKILVQEIINADGSIGGTTSFISIPIR